MFETYSIAHNRKLLFFFYLKKKEKNRELLKVKWLKSTNITSEYLNERQINWRCKGNNRYIQKIWTKTSLWRKKNKM